MKIIAVFQTLIMISIEFPNSGCFIYKERYNEVLRGTEDSVGK